MKRAEDAYLVPVWSALINFGVNIRGMRKGELRPYWLLKRTQLQWANSWVGLMRGETAPYLPRKRQWPRDVLR